MSNHSPSTSPSSDGCQEAAPLAWLLALLREAMEGVMADDTPPLKKANALARLGSLYLKIYHTADLESVNVELVERVAELEERLAGIGMETAAGAEAVAGPARPEPEASPAPSRKGSAKPSKPRSHGRHRPNQRHHSRPSHRGDAAG
jgi:hypothetical protein